MQMIDAAESKITKDSPINVSGFEGLRDLVSRIPEGTIYSVDLSEVIRIGQNNGES